MELPELKNRSVVTIAPSNCADIDGDSSVTCCRGRNWPVVVACCESFCYGV